MKDNQLDSAAKELYDLFFEILYNYGFPRHEIYDILQDEIISKIKGLLMQFTE